MKYHLALFAVFSTVLASCTGFQLVTYNKEGKPNMVAQVDATMAEGENSAREIVLPDGTRLSSVQQKYDGTRIPGALIDGNVTKALGSQASDNQRVRDTFDGKAKVKGTVDPQAIPGKAAGEALIKGTKDQNIRD